MSNEDDADYAAQATASIAALQAKDVDARSASHQEWWAAFWTIVVEIPDKNIEREYYACCTFSRARRDRVKPRRLWGDWVMKNPAWNGDYRSTSTMKPPSTRRLPQNHVELTDAYDKGRYRLLPLAGEP